MYVNIAAYACVYIYTDICIVYIKKKTLIVRKMCKRVGLLMTLGIRCLSNSRFRPRPLKTAFGLRSPARADEATASANHPHTREHARRGSIME